jgi:hypothetical protein
LRRERTEALASNADLLAVGLVDDTVNLLEVVRVGDDLVTGKDVLLSMLALCQDSATSKKRIKT